MADTNNIQIEEMDCWAVDDWAAFGISLWTLQKSIKEEPAYISESDPSKALFSVRWTADCRAGALAITPTDDGCIILCDEQKQVSDKNWRISTAYEFDWDGRPWRKLCLGCDVQAITYNPQRRLLIALTTNEQNEYMFIAYRL